MSDIPPETKETAEIPQTEAAPEKLSPTGRRSMQGLEPVQQSREAVPETDPGILVEQADQPVPSGQSELIFNDPTFQAEWDQWKHDHDSANWEYKLGSPHADYQAAKDLETAQRQYEIGQQAATSDNLGEAIGTTLAAKKGAEPETETPQDQYFREKYGTHPYTTDAFTNET